MSGQARRVSCTFGQTLTRAVEYWSSSVCERVYIYTDTTEWVESNRSSSCLIAQSSLPVSPTENPVADQIERYLYLCPHRVLLVTSLNSSGWKPPLSITPCQPRSSNKILDNSLHNFLCSFTFCPWKFRQSSVSSYLKVSLAAVPDVTLVRSFQRYNLPIAKLWLVVVSSPHLFSSLVTLLPLSPPTTA